MDKTKIPLEVILPESIKKSIIDSVDIFRKGISLSYNKSIACRLEIGYVELDNVIMHNDRNTFDIICEEVSKFYEISLMELFADTRKRPICEKRQLIQYFASKYTRLTQKEIAIKVNRVNHTTTSYAIELIKNLILTDKKYAAEYDEIDKRIKQKILNYGATIE